MYKNYFFVHYLIGDMNMKKVTLLLCAIFIILVISNNSISEEIVIPNESIRIRVIANSNSIKDQELKKKVKKSIQKELTDMLKDAKSIEEVRLILKDRLDGVKYTVESTLNNNNNGIDLKYDVNYGYNFFPKKIYKGVTYNDGYYESLVIKLGEAKGDNWWCVLFPPLCLMDEYNDDIEEVEYKSFVKELIDKYF